VSRCRDSVPCPVNYLLRDKKQVIFLPLHHFVICLMLWLNVDRSLHVYDKKYFRQVVLSTASLVGDCSCSILRITVNKLIKLKYVNLISVKQMLL